MSTYIEYKLKMDDESQLEELCSLLYTVIILFNKESKSIKITILNYSFQNWKSMYKKSLNILEKLKLKEWNVIARKKLSKLFFYSSCSKNLILKVIL